MSIGENIKKLRKDAKITQKELANRIGVNEVTIRSYEAGKYEPKFDKLNLIAKALNVSIFALDEQLAKTLESHEKKIMNLANQYIEIMDNTSLSAKEKTNREQFLGKQLLNAERELLNMQEVRVINTDKVIDAEKPKTQDLIIDTDIDPTHPYNIYWEKKRSGKELTEEEQQEFNDFLASGFMHEVIERARSTSIKFGESLKKLYSVYDQLNETGQEKVLEHAEMLAEIPKYRKGTTEEQE